MPQSKNSFEIAMERDGLKPEFFIALMGVSYKDFQSVSAVMASTGLPRDTVRFNLRKAAEGGLLVEIKAGKVLLYRRILKAALPKPKQELLREIARRAREQGVPFSYR